MKLQISKNGPTALWPRLLRAIAQSTVIALLLLCAPVVVNAQTTYGEEAAQRIRAAEHVAPLEDTMFGEQISLYNGSTKFRVVDASLPSHNGLKVEFARNIGGFDLSDNFFAWDIDVPKITTILPRSWSGGWTPDPPEVAYNQEGVAFQKSIYWQGFRLTTGGGTENLLYRGADARITLPAMSGDFRFLTKSGWALQTVPAASGVGSTVIAYAPNGNKYYFDHLVVFTYYGNVQHPTAFKTLAYDDGNGNSGGSAFPATLDRQKLTLFVSKVEDRFGNWVKYQWSGGKLLRIYANDGREIVITSDKLVPELSDAEENSYVLREIAVNGRVWKYNRYPIEGFHEVVNPDGSTWRYEGLGYSNPIDYQKTIWVYEGGKLYEKSLLHDIIPCSKGYDFTAGQQRVLKIKHPSGATAAYEFVPMRHGRTNVPFACFQQSDDPEKWNSKYSTFDDVFSLVSKTVSGPGLATKTTTYSYEGLDPAFDQSAEGYSTTLPTPNHKTVTVREVDGSFRKLIFGRDWGLSEGISLSTSQYSSQGALVRQTDNSYLTPADVETQPFPLVVGGSGVLFGDGFASYNLPLRSRVIQQDGTTFTSYVETYDKFANPARMRRYSSLGYSKTDITTYYDNLAKWVLGQIATVTNTNTTPNVISSKTDYDPTTALPIRVYGPGTTLTPGKLQQTLSYYADGSLATVKDGNNNVTTLSSWYRGIPRLIKHPATSESPTGATESASVNDSGWITSVVDENGYATGYGYDPMGRLASIVYPTDDSTVWNTTTLTFAPIATAEYGIPAGHWKQTVSTGNGRKETYFDALWRPLVTREYDNANVTGTQRFTRRSYDADGRLAFQSYPGTTDALTTGIWSLYDPLDRVTSVSQDSEQGLLTTTTAYLTGFQTRVTNPRGMAATTSYLAYDQPATDWPLAITHPEVAYTDIVRDVFGKPKSVTRRNAGSSLNVTRSFVYDGYQQLCKQIEPETGMSVLTFDAAGNLGWTASAQSLNTTDCLDVNAVSATARVNRTYDGRNRVATLRFPGGLGDQNWTYYADNLPKSITTYNGANYTVPVITAYNYNKRRLLDGQGESLEQPGWYTWGIGYGYDNNGALARHVYTMGNLTVEYAPNALGQPTQAGTYATGVNYFPNGAIKQFTYGNGIVHTMAQNARQLPARSTDDTAFDFGYVYDKNSNVTAITDYAQAGRQNRTLTYDGLDRLKTAASPMFATSGSGTASYTYDVLDNLTRVTVPATAMAAARDHYYCYDTSWRLTNVKTGSCSGTSVIGLGYDAQGNLANKNGVVYTFDKGNRLRTVTNQESYRYDALGRRVLAWSPTLGNIRSQYSQSGQLMFQANARSGKNYAYVYLGGSLVGIGEQPNAGGTFTPKYQHTDALGTPVAVTSSTRAVLERSEYDPYGKLLNRPLTDGPGYTGHVQDAATGLTYMQQRYYDPGIGRFLSVDPVTANGNTGGNFNRYKYAANNPYRFTDPDGRYECGGSKKDCAAIDNAIKAAGTAAKNLPEGSKEQKSLNRVLGFLGKAGDKNGVTVQLGSKGSIPGSLGGAKTVGGKTTIGIPIDKIAEKTPGRDSAKFQDRLAGAVIHEGDHGATQKDNGGMPGTRAEAKAGDIGAYTTEAALYQGLNSPHSGNQLWTPGVGRRDDMIERAAEESTQMWCQVSGC